MDIILSRTHSEYKTALKYLIVIFMFGIAWFLFVNLPVKYTDWILYFKPSSLNWRSPYQEGVFNPPWLFPLLYPIALLPDRVGAGLFALLSMVIVAVYVKSPIKTLIVACSTPMLVNLALGQVDALPILGLALSGGFGIPLILLKPQGSFLATLFRFNRRSMALVIFVLILSVLVWGLWWQVIAVAPVSGAQNSSIFPYSIPVGILALVVGTKRKSDALLCLASLCCSPYWMISSMLPAITAAIKETDDWWWWVLIVVGTWVYGLAV